MLSISLGMPRLITKDSFSPERWVEIVTKHRVSVVLMGAPHIAQLVKSGLLQNHSMTFVKRLISLGCILPVDIAQTISSCIPNGKIFNVYALTESGKIASELENAFNLSVGKLSPGVQAKIVNEAGEKLGVGEVGELCVKTHVEFMGYFNNPEATAAARDSDGWIRTGDLAKFDDNGHLIIKGRKKFILKYNNFHVSPTELEEILCRHPDVLQVAVVGVPDSLFNDLPAAVVVRRENSTVDEEELLKFLEGKIVDFKKLRGGVYFVRELPTTPSGKVKSGLVKEMAVCQISVDDATTRTNGEIHKASLQIACSLRKLGCSKGDVVTFVCRNTHDLTPAILAALFLGAPVNVLDILFTKEYGSNAEICVLGQKVPNFLHINDLMDVKDDKNTKADIQKLILHPPEVDKDSCALIVCSSGTTGFSKGVAISHEGFLKHFYKPHWKSFSSLDDKVFSFASFYWLSGYTCLMLSISLGMPRLITKDSFSPERWVEIVTKHRVSVVLMGAPHIAQLVKSGLLQNHSMTFVKRLISLGCILPVDIAQTISSCIPNGKIFNVYALTESGKIASELENAFNLSVGKLSPGVQAKIVNEAGEKLGVGEVGELCVKTHVEFMPQQLPETATVGSVQEILTNFDDNGHLIIRGRKKFILKHNNFHVSPVELEEILCRHPDVLQVTVVGVPDPLFNDLPAAVVVRRENSTVDEEELLKFLEGKIVDFKKLRGGVYFVRELPTTPSGKVKSGLVKEMAKTHPASTRICSSGTTGFSKGVAISHEGFLKHFYKPHWKSFSSLDDKVFSFASFYWLSGYTCLMLSISLGMPRLITKDSFNPERWVEIVTKHRVSVVLMGAPHIAQLVKSGLLQNHSMTFVKRLISLGCILPVDIAQTISSCIPNGKIFNVYALTESGKIASELENAFNLSVGKLSPGVQAKIVNEAGEKLGVGEVGELCVKDPRGIYGNKLSRNLSFSGYFNNPEATAAARDSDGWIRTGDLAKFDDNGHLIIKGRKKFILKYNNFHVSPTELEEILCRHPDVLQVAVVGVPDSLFNDLPAAVVVRRENSTVDEEELLKFLEGKIVDFKKLRGGVYFVRELPTTPSGKVKSGLVKEMARLMSIVSSRLHTLPPAVTLNIFASFRISSFPLKKSLQLSELVFENNIVSFGENYCSLIVGKVVHIPASPNDQIVIMKEFRS
uniref:Putative acyl-coa synthetase n=1 Tax=Lutzomyia longipalpis TaxID=7200 RepID=A0A1B0GHX0_LUTLO